MSNYFGLVCGFPSRDDLRMVIGGPFINAFNFCLCVSTSVNCIKKGPVGAWISTVYGVDETAAVAVVL